MMPFKLADLPSIILFDNLVKMAGRKIQKSKWLAAKRMMNHVGLLDLQEVGNLERQ